jgi:hypothetical protein
LLGGCDDLSDQDWVKRVLDSGETLTRVAQRALISPKALAREYSEADLSKKFKANGSSDPQEPNYLTHVKKTASPTGSSPSVASSSNRSSFHWKISAPCRRAPRSRGMTVSKAGAASANGRTCRSLRSWTRRSSSRTPAISCSVAPTTCSTQEKDRYYESIALVDAFHPQTILAYEMNDQALPVAHGAPLRLRVERQLGYKMAKYVMRVEAVDEFATIRGGRGGFWEDLGYEWYAGI